MIYDYYHFETSSDRLTFEFESIGTRGVFIKVVHYSAIGEDLYNLGFGDKETDTNHINDRVVTNNNDSQKVLATVVQTLYVFTAHYPNATVIATGSTDARTRLYQIGISNNLIAAQQNFIILGFVENNWELFRKNMTYEAFAVRRKF